MELNDNHTFMIPRLFLKDVDIETSDVRGFESFSIHNPKQPIEYEVLYLHGGAYARGIKLHHVYLMRALAMRLNARVTMIDYPLAPQHQAEETTDVCMELYRTLSNQMMEQGNQVHVSKQEVKRTKGCEMILVGDSAGAGLALALAMMIRDYNQLVPKKDCMIAPSALVLYSPWLDVGMTNPKIRLYEDKDYILDYKALVDIGKAYAGELAIQDFRVSPAYGVLEQLGKICVFYGTDEMFYPDCQAFVKKRDIDGTTIHGVEYQKMPHDWVVLPIEEREMALDQTVQFIRGQEGVQMQKKGKIKQQQGTWRRLDNTAHIFPLISNANYSNVFRVSVVLNKTINPEMLQKAFEETLQWFPHFQSRIRKGVFWYYFEKNHYPVFQVEQERGRPCSYIDRRKNNQYLFKVLYYKRRLTLEVFHVLTDGTGAMKFLKALTANYLRLCQGEAIVLDSDIVDTLGDIEDSYKRHYKKRNIKSKASDKMDKAYMVRGKKLDMYQMGIVHGHLNIKELSAWTKANNQTITVYLASVYLWSIYKSEHLEGAQHPSIRLSVPVNLRPYFDSTTSMNFYSFIAVSLDARDEEWTFDAIVESVKEQFARQIHKEAFEKRIVEDVKKSKNIAVRLVPRVIKYPIVKAVYRKSLSKYTTTLSNIGKITMPQEYAQQIQHFEMMLNPTKTGRIKLGIAGFGNELVLSFTSQLVDTRIQRYFFRKLAQDGLEVKIESNGVYYEDV